MASSGKSVRMDGKPVRCDTGMIIWGEAGNNAQHSFMQLLHQGTRFVPVDFVLSESSDLATANCRAQAEALMTGTTDDDIESHRIHKGNRPSNTIHYKEIFVTGSHGSIPRQHEAALGLIACGAIKAEPLITHTLPLADIREAFDLVETRTGMKVVVEP